MGGLDVQGVVELGPIWEEAANHPLRPKALFNQNKNQGTRFIIDAFHTIPLDLKYYACNYSKILSFLNGPF